MARVTVSVTPQTVIPAHTRRDVLELINDTDTTVHVLHGGNIDLGSADNCGIPLPPRSSRAVSGPMAQQAVQAVLAAGQANVLLHYHQNILPA